MSNAGKQYRSEMEFYTDRKSGRRIRQLTKSGDNFHFYFTENSFTAGDSEIIYCHFDNGNYTLKSAVCDLYAMDLTTGVRTQLTDLSKDFGSVSFLTKSVDSKYVIAKCDGDIYRFDRDTGALTLLYRTPADFENSGATISHDNKYLAITMIEKVKFDRTFASTNYDGFVEKFYGYKRGKMVLITMDGLYAETVLTDTHMINHVQFAPDTNEMIMFCHEGPWNMVAQRIWLFNTLTRTAVPCFRQKADDSVGHEFWTRDGLIFFDNRGKGHDGTITVDKTQATVMDSDGKDAIPWVGFADKSGSVVRRLELPYYCNHYHASKDNTRLVADAVNDIVLLDISTDKPAYEILCEHNTSWIAHDTHCHPTWSWSNDKILFASDRERTGYAQLYLIDM